MDSDLVGVIEFSLSLSRNRSNIIYSELELVLLKNVKKILVYDSLRKQLQHFQVAVVRVAEPCVLEARVIYCSDLIKEVEGNFGCPDRFFP